MTEGSIVESAVVDDADNASMNTVAKGVRVTELWVAAMRHITAVGAMLVGR